MRTLYGTTTGGQTSVVSSSSFLSFQLALQFLKKGSEQKSEGRVEKVCKASLQLVFFFIYTIIQYTI